MFKSQLEPNQIIPSQQKSFQSVIIFELYFVNALFIRSSIFIEWDFRVGYRSVSARFRHSASLCRQELKWTVSTRLYFFARSLPVHLQALSYSRYLPLGAPSGKRSYWDPSPADGRCIPLSFPAVLLYYKLHCCLLARGDLQLQWATARAQKAQGLRRRRPSCTKTRRSKNMCMSIYAKTVAGGRADVVGIREKKVNALKRGSGEWKSSEPAAE